MELLQAELESRALPELMAFEDGSPATTREDWARRRAEIAAILCREVYGFLPPAPRSMVAEVLEDPVVGPGGVLRSKVRLRCRLERGEFAFPIRCAVPDRGGRLPAIVHLHFGVGDVPVEEICGRGAALFTVHYEDVAPDRDDGFAEGLAALTRTGEARTEGQAGKIALWAWAASRVMDHLRTLPWIDSGRVAVVGHSRLGKTALLAGGLDERFRYVVSNDSGCSGAAITRGKTGEHVRDICANFPYWFCTGYPQYAGREEEMPFEQHFLLALTAPRKLYVASATEDPWADPMSEYLACVAASPAWRLLGGKGFVHPDRLPRAEDRLHEGDIGYHLREGRHALTPEDWRNFLGFMESDAGGAA